VQRKFLDQVDTAREISDWEEIMRTARIAAALSIAGAMSLGSYQTANAAPLTPLSAAAKPALADSNTVQVRFGGWGGGWHGGWGRGWGGGWGRGWGGGWGGWGWGIGALAAGALIGAAIASPVYAAPYYYGGYPYGGYGYPYYGYGGYYPTYAYYQPRWRRSYAWYPHRWHRWHGYGWHRHW
jgi:hypothetical protein